MKIGIFVHSKTGNTRSVAERLLERLTANGHTVDLQRISAENDDEADFKKIVLKDQPDVEGYDVLMFGAPVRGFSLSPVMQAYLNTLGPLANRETACFVTQFLPYPWLGGNRAIKQMSNICIVKGAKIVETGIVNWSVETKRERLIQEVIERMCHIS